MSKAQANQEVAKIIERAINISKPKPELSKKLIKKAKRIAMHHHMKIPEEYKNTFCKKCFTIFNSKNSKIRIKNKLKTITCLSCNFKQRKRL